MRALYFENDAMFVGSVVSEIHDLWYDKDDHTICFYDTSDNIYESKQIFEECRVTTLLLDILRTGFADLRSFGEFVRDDDDDDPDNEDS